MKVYTFRFNKRIAVFALLILAVVLLALVFTIGHIGDSDDDASGIQTNGDIISFLDDRGIEVSREPLCEKNVIIPTEFSDIYMQYNKLQIAQGYDLSLYKGKEVTVYTYEVVNYADYNGEVLLDIYIYDGGIIGGDIHSAALDGFISGF